MTRLMLAVAALAATLALPVSSSSAATLPRIEAPHNDTLAVRHRHFGHRFHGPRVFYHRPHRFRHFHYGLLLAPPVYYSAHRGGCAWLRHRAVVTGSPYWWRRYKQCRYGW